MHDAYSYCIYMRLTKTFATDCMNIAEIVTARGEHIAEILDVPAF